MKNLKLHLLGIWQRINYVKIVIEFDIKNFDIKDIKVLIYRKEPFVQLEDQNADNKIY